MLELQRLGTYEKKVLASALEQATVIEVGDIKQYFEYLKRPHLRCIGVGANLLTFRVYEATSGGLERTGLVLKTPCLLPVDPGELVTFFEYLKVNNEFSHPEKDEFCLEPAIYHVEGLLKRREMCLRGLRMVAEREFHHLRIVICAHHLAYLKRPDRNIPALDVFMCNGYILGFTTYEVEGEIFNYLKDPNSRIILKEFKEAGGIEPAGGANIIKNATTILGTSDYLFIDLEGLPIDPDIYGNI